MAKTRTPLRLKALINLALGFCVGQAAAQDCPGIFRFADFGIEGADGAFSRGGPVFRGENLDFQPMLLREKTICRAVPDLAKDGRLQPVPVVTSITYDVAKTGTRLTGLRVSYAKDTEVSAQENAKQHHARLETLEPVRGEDFLCAASGDLMSCQLVSPYLKTADLVVYCDPTQCRMPVMAVGETVQISAEWHTDTASWPDPERTGQAISERVQDIHAFFRPLTSGLPPSR